MKSTLDSRALLDQIISVLDRVRPALASHGGGADVVSYQDGVLILAVKGACKGCAMSAFTFQLGIERILRAQYPEIKEVRYV